MLAAPDVATAANVRTQNSTLDVITFETDNHTYTITDYPSSLANHPHAESIIWMRTVYQHLTTLNTPTQARKTLFTQMFGISQPQKTVYNRRYKQERLLASEHRVTVSIKPKKLISVHTSDKRARKRQINTAKRMRDNQEDTFRATAVLVRFGLLKSGGKYIDLMRTTRKMSKGKRVYGIGCGQYPVLESVNELATAIYKHPKLLTNAPDWVIKYGKGRLKVVDDQLLLPSQQVTVSQIKLTDNDDQDSISQRIFKELHDAGFRPPVAVKVRKGNGPNNNTTAAAYVYFNSAYEARCAVPPLQNIGRVSLGQTIVTSRVVASTVRQVIETILSEADSYLAQDFHPDVLCRLSNTVNINLDLQEWIDKDGRVTFIKLKIVDPSHTVFKTGESRVHYLLEYVGNEGECRRFYPILVDQFAECNATTFYLHNGFPLRVTLTLTSGDHLAAWAKTGRSGGHDRRDCYSNNAMASLFHVLAYQDKPQFEYKRHVTSRKRIEEALDKWVIQQREAKIIPSNTARKAALHNLYLKHGRVERMPALVNGTTCEVPSVYNKLLMTPLALHNQSYCCLITLELGLKFVIKPKSPNLNKLQGRYKGLVDGIGTTKCATSGTGIRNLINDCLFLEKDTADEASKYASIWYLMDTICSHLHIKGRTKKGVIKALMDHERLAFASCTFCWWGLMGDLSTWTGGRKLKTCTKNHLEDKIYVYEIVNTCPEWEEHTGIPMSLVDESLFEASFVPRDEMINSQRSKVNIEGERKIQFATAMLRTIVPKKKQRSLMNGLPRHIRRNIIIRACWQSQTKWSFNLHSGFLRRCAKYSYHNRISFSQQQHIFINITGPQDPFYTQDQTPPTVIIDPCGACQALPVPTTFDIPLAAWWVARLTRRVFIRFKLRKTYTARLKTGHLKRAQHHRDDIKRILLLPKKARDASEFKHAYDGYFLYHIKYPLDLPIITTSRMLRDLLEKANKIKVIDAWDGDSSDLPPNLNDITTTRTWTVQRLKAVIRYFQIQGIKDTQLVSMKGNRLTLTVRVINLLTTYRAQQVDSVRHL